MNYINAIKNRRSVYAIGNKEVATVDEIKNLVESAVANAPSPMNLQSDRAVVLFAEHHEKLWDIVLSTLKAIVPAESFAKTENKIKSFAAGYASVLFFQDTAAIQKLEDSLPELYKANVKNWCLQSNAMLQYAVWAGVASLGLGSSLQHYNPLIDDAVKAQWKLPEHWHLVAQMPIGSIEAPAGEKESLPIGEKFLSFE